MNFKMSTFCAGIFAQILAAMKEILCKRGSASFFIPKNDNYTAFFQPHIDDLLIVGGGLDSEEY